MPIPVDQGIFLASQVPATIASIANVSSSPIPTFTRAPFGIGTWQYVLYGTIFATGFPTAGINGPLHPYGGIYGGTFGYVLDTTIRAPQQLAYTPAQEVGLDATGLVVVRGYPQMTWTWNTLRPDNWYYFLYVYTQSQRAPAGFKGLVLLMYPDTSSNTPQLVLAQMNPPTHSARDVGSFQGVTLTFEYLGQAVLAPDVLVQIYA
jgi:hypothetical protein